MSQIIDGCYTENQLENSLGVFSLKLRVPCESIKKAEMSPPLAHVHLTLLSCSQHFLACFTTDQSTLYAFKNFLNNIVLLTLRMQSKLINLVSCKVTNTDLASINQNCRC